MPTLKACLNGARPRSAHPALPITPSALAADAAATVAAGATALHIHPRAAGGGESLAAGDVGAAVAAVQGRVPGVPLGVTTGGWIEPDPGRRLALVGAWEVLPDFASVNFSEAGAAELARLLLDRGVGVEAGLLSPADVEALLASGLAPDCLRLLLEPAEADPDAAIGNAAEMLRSLGDAAPGVPVLLHGEDDAAWPVLAEAARRGLETRIGLEDCLTLPGGDPAPDNAALVQAAVRLIAAGGDGP